jgi:hypothetical protein
MQVRVTSPFKLRGELMNPGTLLNIPDEVLPKLAGRVEPVELSPNSSLLIKWKTKTGRDIYLITSERIRRMAPEGKAVFSLDELNHMRNLPEEQVEAIITTKETIHDAIVGEVADENII